VKTWHLCGARLQPRRKSPEFGMASQVAEKVNLKRPFVVDRFHVAGSPRGTPQRSPRRKPWETNPVMTRKPRQGRHFGLTRTDVTHYPASVAQAIFPVRVLRRLSSMYIQEWLIFSATYSTAGLRRRSSRKNSEAPEQTGS
jgi:hypothetical protein